jgi:phage-related protein
LDAAENAEVFNDNIGRLKEGMGQLLTDAITPLLPHLVRLSEEIMANMPAIIEKVQAAFTALEPVFSLIGTVLTDLVFPILSRVFEVLGNIATAIAPLVESAIPLLKTAFESLVAIVESIVGFFQGVAESLQGIYDKAIQLKDGVAGTFDNMADSVKNKTKDMTDSVSGWFNDMYMKVVGGSIVPDMVREVIAEFKRMDQGVTTTTQQMTGKATDAFTSLSDSIIDSMENGKLASGDFAGFFKDTMFSLVKDAMNGGNQLQSIFDGIFGGGAGGGGGLLGGLFGGGGGGGLGGLFSGGMGGIFSNFGSMFSGITSGISNFFGGLFGGGGGLGSLFGGFFANGGTLGAGKFGIAGEAGPELITGPATITPAAELGGAPSVNITIQAIDTQTGTEFLLKNKKQVESIIQNAYNRRGKQGIY